MHNGDLLRRSIPALFVGLWATGFVGAKFLLPHCPPFTLLTLRFGMSAVLLVSIAVFIREPIRMTGSQLTRAAYISVFLHLSYTGGIFFAISRGVPAGIAAVIVSLQPIIVALLAVPLLQERLRFSQVLGLGLGLVGVGLLLLPKVLSGNVSLAFPAAGVIGAIIALVGSVWGTIEQKRFGSDLPMLSGMAFQYTISGVILAVLAVTTEDPYIELSIQFVAVLLWIVLGISMGSVALLFYMLRNGSAGSVSSLLYLGTPLAALFGYLFFDERIRPLGMLGMALAVCGVWLVLRSSSSSVTQLRETADVP